jgi:hypothetical protein
MDIEFTEDTYIKRPSTSQHRLDSRTSKFVEFDYNDTISLTRYEHAESFLETFTLQRFSRDTSVYDDVNKG